MDLWLSFAIATIACIALMPVLIKYANVLGMIDIPDARKIHQKAIPRCGGIAIATGTFIAILSLVKGNQTCNALMAGALVITIFGLLDDRFNLHYKWKFLGQFIAALLVISQGIYLHALPFLGLEDAPVWISYPLTVFFVIGVTNAVNLADGLDGLAAGVMLLTLGFIVIFAVYAGGTEVAIMALAIGGGLMGFLKFNTYPAIVFMGDVGSQFIGFMAVNLTILLTQNVNPALNSALPVLILGVPILDTLSVMVKRLRAGLSPFSPDKRHLHHKLMSYGLSQPISVSIIYIMQSLFLLMAALLRYAADWQVLGVYFLFSGCILAILYWLSNFHFQQAKPASIKDRRKTRFLSSPLVFKITREYIEISLVLFLIVLVSSLFYSININYQYEFLLIGIALLLYRFLNFKVQDFIVRCSVYMGAIIFSFVKSKLPIDELLNTQLINIFLIILFLMTCLATRITRKCYFIFNTQDLLMALFLLSAIFFIKIDYLTQAFLYLFCCGYALEYLLQRDFYQIKIIRLLAFLSMLNISLFIVVSN